MIANSAQAPVNGFLALLVIDQSKVEDQNLIEEWTVKCTDPVYYKIEANAVVSSLNGSVHPLLTASIYGAVAVYSGRISEGV